MYLHSARKPEPAAGGSYNLSQGSSGKKGHYRLEGIVPAPQVCTILGACGGATKVIALPAATEGGTKVTRGLFVSPSADKKSDMVILERQTYNDNYFYLVSADGNLQKAAFVQLGSKAWSPVAVSLVQPQFDKEKQIWHDHVAKLGAAPAAAPATEN